MPQPITAQNVSAARLFPGSSSHLQADTGPQGCGVLQPHDAVYPVGLSRQAQPGTGASRIEEPVRGASHSSRSPVERVRVDLCGADIPVPEELLNGADVGPVLEQVGGEGVAQGVRCGSLRDPGSAHRAFHDPLANGLVQVVPATLAGVPVHIEACRGEDPLPYPLPAPVRILPSMQPRLDGAIHALDPSPAGR
jgi:hypothetical protein